MFKLLKDKLISEGCFNAGQIEELLSYFQPLATEKGQILLHKGETSRYLYFINKGCLRVFCIQPDGKESTRFFAFEGRFGTAFPSFILQQPSVALIDTVDKSELLRINYSDFQALLATVPGWETLYRKELERDYVDSILRIESFVTMNAAERYQRILQHEPHLIHRLPNRIVASYMGISQETLSRLKSDRRF
ncbi:Crp/Fnr family transcriptional regulator [Fulvivirga kasyanovii]|uniref:Crp/Fnr family transcriptional regulator n=1 Tax=Fulvivirga kasyanovii TaxID=396812 RepID=A0ABW9RX68_9BACT|nr:Crp/Fnr family transcriptional regulator [Fulvivirga kasyanovii]MTI28301.1 Crp/Fnr family transcriptional regulator [Fulvivirga kasyanovii]